jgi:hypothetical protein
VRRARKTVQWTVFSAKRAEPRGGGRRPGRHPHPAERQIGGGPDLDPRAVGRKHRALDVVGPHKADHATLNHCNRRPVQPDVLPDQRPCRLVIFGNPFAVGT